MLRRAILMAVVAAAACTNAQPCPSPLEECGGQCVDVQSDRRNCGGCGIACRPGEVCIGSGCTADPNAPCPDRVGGAFVTLGHCGRAVKLWVRKAEFITGAQALLVAPDPSLVPSLAVVAKSDCDGQWSWHVDAAAASLVPLISLDPSVACTGCPDAIQANVAAYVLSPRTWCPTGARVLAVDERPLPP